MSLEAELKKAMGYKVPDPCIKCENCQFAEEKDHPVLDRAWVWQCNYPNTGPIAIEPNGICSKFEKRKPKKKKCSHCGGRGVMSDDSYSHFDCPWCDGSGKSK
jgi:hypothetical protein